MIRVSMTRVLTALALAVSCLLSPAQGVGEAGSADGDFSEFASSLMESEMERFKVPGAVLVVVADGGIVLARGYGFADIEGETPVDAETTLFRVASISKLYTAVAVLQQHERGNLDVSNPVGTYLEDVVLPLGFPEPVTIHHLLTHTAGFDMTDIGDAAPSAERIVGIEETVRGGMTPQVLPPGRFYSYSNHGFTLAGYLVSRVSGRSFETYAGEEIFEPLGMTRSSFAQPPPQHMENLLASAYDSHWNGSRTKLERDYSNILPADGMVTTGADQARFMLAILGGGALDGARILEPETAVLMTTQHFTRAGSPRGMAYAFHEEAYRGRRVLEHTGGQLGFLTLLQILPEENLGVFISHNNRSISSALRKRVSERILDRLLGEGEAKAEEWIARPDAGAFGNAASDAGDFAGVYRQVDHPRSSFEKVMTLFGMFATEVRVREGGEGTLSIRDASYERVAARLFRRIGEPAEYREFLLDEEGRATHLVYGRRAFERTPWYWQNRFRHGILATCGVFILVQALVPLRRLYGKLANKKAVRAPGDRMAKVCGAVHYWSGTCLVLFGVLLVAHLSVSKDQLSDYGVPLTFKAVLLVGTIGFLLSAALPVTTFAIWRRRHPRLYVRVLQTATNAATIIVCAYLYALNVVGWNF